MRRHTIEGEEILATVPEITEVAHLVRACHERYDGDGYPDGIAGEDIPLVARIVFCADAFHAMRCDRPYRAGRPAAEALAEMRANAGTQFDPVVVAALCDVHATLAIQRKHGLGILRSGARSRRLVVLLATLTVSGSAMAATGAYKALPLVQDDHGPSVPAVTHDPMAAVRAPAFGAGHPTVPASRQGAVAGASAGPRAESRSSSGGATRRAATSPGSGGAADAPGAQGAPAGAPGQVAAPAPEKRRLFKNRKPKAKDPKADRRRGNGPKLELPDVKVKVDVPKVEVPKVDVPKVKLPKLKR